MFVGWRLLLMILRLFYLPIVKTFIYTTVSRKRLLLVGPNQRWWTLLLCLGRHRYLALLFAFLFPEDRLPIQKKVSPLCMIHDTGYNEFTLVPCIVYPRWKRAAKVFMFERHHSSINLVDLYCP